MKKNTKNLPFALENKVSLIDKFSKQMKFIKPDNYVQNKKLLLNWTDKKKYLIQYRMLKNYVWNRMVVDKIDEVISIRESKWLEKYINLNTKKEIRLKMVSEKTSIINSITPPMEKRWQMLEND